MILSNHLENKQECDKLKDKEGGYQMKKAKVITRWIKRLLICYLVFVCVFAIGIYYIPKHTFATMDPSTYYQEDVGCDRVVLVEHPQEAFSRRVELIRSAKKTLDVCYHNIKKGESADCFVGELIQAADRGVHVRVLLDDVLGGLQGEHKNLKLALLSHPNIEYRGYNPIHLLKPWDFHVRLHDKFIIADDAAMMLGGRNIGDEYFDPPYYDGKVTNDRDVLVLNTKANTKQSKDSVLADGAFYMNELWTSNRTAPQEELSNKELEEGKQAQSDAKAICNRWQKEYKDYYFPKETMEHVSLPTHQVSLLHNPLDGYKKEPVVGATVCNLLKNGKDIIIQTPYATANKYLLHALKMIAHDADVTLLTNSLASSPNYPAFSNYITQRKKFIQTGVNIYEYQSKDSIHGKTCLANERLSIVGSLNLDDRSLYIDTESVLVIDSKPFYQQLHQEMCQLIDDSAFVMPDNTYDPNAQGIVEVSFGKKCMMWVVSIFSRMFQCLI